MLDEKKKIEIEIIVRENGEEKKHKFTIYPPFDGYYDWKEAKKICKENNGRIPSIDELLIAHAVEKMGLSKYHFADANYWSGSVQRGQEGRAWFVSADGGFRIWDDIDDGFLVRCVRS